MSILLYWWSITFICTIKGEEWEYTQKSHPHNVKDLHFIVPKSVKSSPTSTMVSGRSTAKSTCFFSKNSWCEKEYWKQTPFIMMIAIKNLIESPIWVSSWVYPHSHGMFFLKDPHSRRRPRVLSATAKRGCWATMPQLRPTRCKTTTEMDGTPALVMGWSGLNDG